MKIILISSSEVLNFYPIFENGKGLQISSLLMSAGSKRRGL